MWFVDFFADTPFVDKNIFWEKNRPTFKDKILCDTQGLNYFQQKVFYETNYYIENFEALILALNFCIWWEKDHVGIRNRKNRLQPHQKMPFIQVAFAHGLQILHSYNPRNEQSKIPEILSTSLLKIKRVSYVYCCISPTEGPSCVSYYLLQTFFYRLRS